MELSIIDKLIEKNKAHSIPVSVIQIFTINENGRKSQQPVIKAVDTGWALSVNKRNQLITCN